MISAPDLLRDLQRLTTTLEADLRERTAATPDLDGEIAREWQAARAASRTAETLHDFREETITQAAVHWLLMGVFVRFLEDNGLVDQPWLTAADPERRRLAEERHENYFRRNPGQSDREYLQACFHEVAGLPGMGALFDARHNPIWRLAVSGDGAMAILGFWRKIDPDSGRLIHDFTDPEWNTRFLGDLYQDLSAAAKKRFALLQTPEFVEEFILDRTLDPAIDEFGYREVRLIDPTCGSGHFLLGAFHRLLGHWQRNAPARNARDLVQQALNGVYGVDLNPFAVAIARFRLLIAALKTSGETHIAEAPNFTFHLAVGDSLFHGPRLGQGQLALSGEAENLVGRGVVHAFETEDLSELNRVLGQRYHAVVGNPPYITVKDAALNATYRHRYRSCHRQYSLGVPFTERFFELAESGGDRQPAGYVGMITTNSFMKREFGKKLIEDFLPSVDLTHVIDTSGANIPGHGTPTVILFGRDRTPVAATVRTVMGIKGEPSTPDDPAQGLVWRAIVEQVDLAGSESAFVSVADTARITFARHPWSLGGGGAVDLLDQINGAADSTLGDSSTAIGRTTHTGEDGVFYVPPSYCRRFDLEDLAVPLVEGEGVRDYQLDAALWTLFPYDKMSAVVRDDLPKVLWQHYWVLRTTLKDRRDFGNYIEDRGLRWYEHSMFFPERFRVPLGLAYADIATHNHFVLDRGGKVFNRTAPVIKLPPGAGEAEHLGLLGLLNSSVACFWLQQVCHNKGGPGGGSSKDEKWHDFYAFNGTNIAQFPLVQRRPTALGEKLDRLAQQLTSHSPSTLVTQGVPSRASFDSGRAESESVRRQMISAQEELDWHCYQLYGLTPTELIFAGAPEISLGERAFEIVMARRMATGEFHTSWFEWLKVLPVTECPSHWPADYRRVVEARIALIESDRFIGLVESPNCKRRWETSPWTDQESAALKDWLLDRLESTLKAGDGAPVLTSTQKLADRLRADADFLQVAELYSGRGDFDIAALVAELVAGETVPLLPVLRYTESGRRKRAAWEETWALQRRVDAGEDVGEIPVPPKYKSTDFQKGDYWRLRGGLDVPKERFVSLPHCSRDADGSLVIAWAGLNPLQLATALAGYFIDMKDNEGWEPSRLTPLLAGIAELLPWIKQWHNEPDPGHGTRMGDYLEGFVAEECRGLGLVRGALAAWQPPATTGRRGRRNTT